MKKIFYFLYCLFLFWIVFFSYFFIDPNLIYLKRIYNGFAFGFKLETTVVYILTICVAFIFYFFIIWLIYRKKLFADDIKKIIFLQITILLFAYPAMLSYDIFNYLATAKVLYFYKENPYIIMPISFIHDPLLLFMHAANKTALYGFSWIGLTGIPFLLSFGNFYLSLFFFKLFLVPFYFGLLYTLKKLTNDWMPVLLFACNPLVVIELFVSGHNDIVMMFFALAAIYAFLKKYWMLGSILFILSVFIKFATILLLPLLVYLYLKRNQNIQYEKMWMFAVIIMSGIFFLSAFREEIYPWYAVWVLPFLFILYKKKLLLVLTITFSFSLLLRYVPYMLLGTYASPTPIIRSLITFIPPFIICIYYGVKKLWLK